MIEIRFHGRGGQGAYLASQILALALLKEGKEVQSFPRFGGERRGAPTQAFVRFSDSQIWLSSQVYSPNYVVVLDPTLLETENVVAGLKENGWLIINSKKEILDNNDTEANKYFTAVFDAYSLAKKHKLGSAVNTIMLGALSALGIGNLSCLKEAVRELVPSRIEENIAAITEAEALMRAAGKEKEND
jgi:2-oxoacid:acceptor oxidoreductase gamma subunit (pyruvate/2-ketoisovalerate family)